MKIAVVIKATRADETLVLVKALIARASGSNQIEIQIQADSQELEHVIARYLPADPRVLREGRATGDFLFRVTDIDMPSVPEGWDLDPGIASRFVPFDLQQPLPQAPVPVVDNQDPTMLAPDEAYALTQTGQEFMDTKPEPYQGETGDLYKVPVVEPDPAQEEWEITQTTPIDADTVIAVLKKK